MYMNFFSTNPLQDETLNNRLDKLEEIIIGLRDNTLNEMNNRLQRIEDFLKIFIQTYKIIDNQGNEIVFKF